MYKDVFLSGLMMFIAIFIGSLVGLYTAFGDTLSSYVDYIVLVLVFLVLADAPLNKVMPALKQPLVLGVTWITNFLVLPVCGFALTKLFLPDQPLWAIGLAVYFMSPCTDWFLGFTRMANGNTLLGGVLLPINMLTQLVLYPFYLQWFSESTVASIAVIQVYSAFINWFMIPAALAVLFKLLTSQRGSPRSAVLKEKVKNGLNSTINWIMYALVFAIFCVNIQQITAHLNIFMVLLATVMAFFILVSLLTELVAKKLQFSHADHVLYTMTTTARNAPMMLGLTMTALPEQPLIYAAIIIGMVMEFPFLALQVFRFQSVQRVHSAEETGGYLADDYLDKNSAKKKKSAISFTRAC